MPKKPSVIILSQYFPPDMSGAGTRAYNYSKCLEKNYDVTVITAHPHLHKQVSKKLKWKLIHKENEYGLKIIRVWVPSILHSSARNRIRLHFSYMITSLIPMWGLKPSIIFVFQPNLFSIIPAYIYSKLRGGKVIRAVDDLWPEGLYERGYAKSKILKRILDRLAKFSYHYPKYNLPVVEETAKYLEKFYNISNNKIEVIEHGVDTKIYKYQEKKPSEKFILMYSGSLVESYDFDMILNAAKKLRDENIIFIIRGSGILYSYLQNQKEKYNLENIIIDNKMVPLTEISDILGSADAFMVPMNDQFSLNTNLPTKILEYQSIGRPIICCSNGAPGNFVERTKTGINIEVGNVNAFVEAILSLKSKPELCKTLGRNGRDLIEGKISLEKISHRLDQIIQKTINDK